MATTPDCDGEGECVCPLCEDYRGPPSSVEAHISRKTDETHQGEVGQMHRETLQEDAEGPVRPSIEVDGLDDESGDDGDDMATQEEYEQQYADGEDVDEEDVDEEDAEEIDEPASVDDAEEVDLSGGAAAGTAAAGGGALLFSEGGSKALLYGAGAVVVVLLLYMVLTDDEDDENDENDEEEDDEDDTITEPWENGGMLG